MDFPQKVFYGVFELRVEKRQKKENTAIKKTSKKRKKKGTMVLI
jgi:hypothetical protein